MKRRIIANTLAVAAVLLWTAASLAVQSVPYARAEREIQERLSGLRKAMEADPASAEAAAALCRELVGLGRQHEAREALKDAITKHPNSAELHFIAGTSFLRASFYRDAAKSLKRAVSLDPGHVKAWFYLGSICEINERPAEAAICYAGVLHSQPQNQTARAQLIRNLIKAGRGEEAAKELRILKASRPDLAAQFESGSRAGK